MNLSRVAIRQPVFTTMLMAALVVLGLFSFRRLSIDEYPDVSIPIVSIQTVYRGASPEAVEIADRLHPESSGAASSPVARRSPDIA